jgi:hypothetical protein
VGILPAVNRAARIGLLAASAAVLSVAIWSEFPLCPLAGSLGIPCPGCGLTRATLALLHGDVRGALHFHPLVWLLTPLFGWFMLGVVRELLRDPGQPRAKPLFDWNGRRASALGLGVLLLTLGVWLLRFAGYFGGPVPVTTMHAWVSRASK